MADYTISLSLSPDLPITVPYDKSGAIPINISQTVNAGLTITGMSPEYDEFFLELVVTNPIVVGIPTELVALSGILAESPLMRLPLTDGGITPAVVMNFDNLLTIPNGTYYTNLSYRILGSNGGVITVLDTISGSVVTDISGAGGGDPPIIPLGIDPDHLIFTHALDSALPASQTVQVNSDGAFTTSVFGAVVLSGPSLTLVQTVNGVREYLGTAAQTVTVSLAPEVVDETPGIYELMVVCSQTGGKSDFIGTLGITLYLFETSELVIFPTALEFFAIKNIQEAPSQILTVAGPPAFTLTRPSWLIVTPNSGQNFTEITVEPNPSSTLDEGRYEGNIIITDGVDNYIIPVLHNVYGNVQLGASPNKINFTDDHDTITRFYEGVNYHLNLTLAIDFFNYGSTLLNQTSLAYVLGFFNSRTKFFIGQTLNGTMKELLDLKPIRMDNLAPTISAVVSTIRNYYLPAQVDITALFKHDYDVELDKTHVFEDVKFIKGRRPKTPFDDTFVLDYYRDPLRVTVNSVAMFNFYKEKNHVFRIYKNGAFYSSVSHSVGTQRIFGYKMGFSRFAPGDVVELRLYKNIDGAIDEDWFNTPENYIAQQYIVIPEGKASHHIGYEDEHGLLKIIEFTGSITFENAYESIIAKNYEEFLETLKKLDSKKSRKATINTGFIFEVNTKNIDALLDSKRAWILSDKRKQSISMIPKNKTMIDQDTDQDLYSYDIEFDINFNNDFEINT